MLWTFWWSFCSGVRRTGISNWGPESGVISFNLVSKRLFNWLFSVSSAGSLARVQFPIDHVFIGAVLFESFDSRGIFLRYYTYTLSSLSTASAWWICRLLILITFLSRRSSIFLRIFLVFIFWFLLLLFIFIFIKRIKFPSFILFKISFRTFISQLSFNTLLILLAHLVMFT